MKLILVRLFEFMFCFFVHINGCKFCVNAIYCIVYLYFGFFFLNFEYWFL